MKNLAIIFYALILCCSLSACDQISHWLRKTDMAQEESFAAVEVKTPHPIAAKYDVMTSYGERKEITLYFDSKGLVRIIFTKNPNCKKILNYKKKKFTTVDFETRKEETEKFDPYLFPSVLSARDAKDCGAVCIGAGRLKDSPYHRWRMREGDNEWEVWTDDNDSFPVYFRSIKDGAVTTWSVLNAWIDESLCKIPTFFTLEPDTRKADVEKKKQTKTLEEREAEHNKHARQMVRH